MCVDWCVHLIKAAELTQARRGSGGGGGGGDVEGGGGQQGLRQKNDQRDTTFNKLWILSPEFRLPLYVFSM